MVLTESLTSYKSAVLQHDTAFHLLNVTYPLIKDPKLLLGIVNNISASMQYAMEAILAHERELKLISSYPSAFEGKFNIFRYRCVQRNKISQNTVRTLQEVREILELHKKSPTEFQRGERLVLSTGDYHLKIVALKDIKVYLQHNKEFLEQANKIIHRFDQF